MLHHPQPQARPQPRSGLLQAVGHTPTVPLERLFPSVPTHFFGKLEYLNPGGSAKDRPALLMLEDALQNGVLAPGGVVVESSSGNMAVGLAQAARVLGLRFVCVTDLKTTATNRRLLELYGAQIELVEAPHPDTGDWLDARLARVQQVLDAHPGALWTNQYDNPINSSAHRYGTAPELATSLGGPPDVVLAAASTCGTLGGFVDWRRDTGAHTRIVAVDVQGSKLFGAPNGVRRIPGIGSSRSPTLVEQGELETVFVDDADCVAGCHHLLQQEAILAGGSSGALVAAAARLLPSFSPTDTVALLFMDRGERYLDTVYCPDWLQRTLTRPPVLPLPGRS